ncbi:hypothetical protein EIB71_06890 [Kaistella daneshvariae]|uniref:DUF6759 domain-containing protein n=1 Tax=Kaistella daneshvariae TaxID=2487074 RepID=A0A3N0WW32_9FLAO|nr:DUF6759 domain-containing protein [Kaistella daneshvariae]AZI67410.1 hypothetical protein EIB71_06890 [Kaistella daneshvariae]ROI08329.1 hypothetical protein EGI11_11905 [Kaistella daneshvariae]
MKKTLYLIVFLLSVFTFAQSKYTVQQVEKSTNAQVIANFVKYNPNHPRTPEFKRKLFAIINNDKPAAVKASVAKPTVAPVNKAKLKTAIKKDVAADGSNDKHKRTADLLNHLFNSDPNSRTAYVQIVNKSKCNLIVKISGKKFYNLDVPASNQNFIMVDKGSYTLTTSVCDAKYSSKKNIGKDIVITLNQPR